jgi:hypothetical protein
MTKRLLVLYWSQTGACRSVAERLCLDEEDATRHDLGGPAYPFPWGFSRFFCALPESVLGARGEMTLPPIPQGKWDLVVLVWPIWFLAPPPPVRRWLETSLDGFPRGTRFVSIITCRNVWQAASLEVRALLRGAGHKVVGEIVLSDPTPRILSLLTAPLWFAFGYRARWPGVAPGGALDAPETARIDRLRAQWKSLTDAPGSQAPHGSPVQPDFLVPTVDKTNLLPELAVKKAFRFLGFLVRPLPRENLVAAVPVAVVLSMFIGLIAPPAHLLGRLFHGLAGIFWSGGVRRLEGEIERLDT